MTIKCSNRIDMAIAIPFSIIFVRSLVQPVALFRHLNLVNSTHGIFSHWLCLHRKTFATHSQARRIVYISFIVFFFGGNKDSRSLHSINFDSVQATAWTVFCLLFHFAAWAFHAQNESMLQSYSPIRFLIILLLTMLTWSMETFHPWHTHTHTHTLYKIRHSLSGKTTSKEN